MSIVTVGVQAKTLHIANKFFNDIKVFTPGKANYELQLYPRIEKFFFDMNKRGKKEFSCYLEQQRYTSNINSNNSDDKHRNIDVFYCLVALIVHHYSETDILYYFFPEELREKIGKPTYSRDSWRIAYWCQVLAYWFRGLLGKDKYQLNTSNDHILFILRFVKNAMKNSNYLQLINAGSINLFSSYLNQLTVCILRVAGSCMVRIQNPHISCDYGSSSLFPLSAPPQLNPESSNNSAESSINTVVNSC